MAVTVVDSDIMRARDVEDEEVLRAWLRTRAWCPRMTKLVAKTNTLERNLIEKSAVPSLMTKDSQLTSSHDVTDDMLTSTRCNGCLRCVSTVQSEHFNIHPSPQSLHLMIPSVFPHLEQLVCPRKSPSPSCRNTSSKNVSLNLSHSVSRS